MEPDSIKFYRPNHSHGFMSNFYSAPFSQGKITYPTSEHYYQSKKFQGTPYQQKVIQAQTPSQAFKLGRNRKFPCRADWNQVKQQIMLKALRLKFKTHADLRQKLLETGSLTLIQHTPRDSYWGDGGNGKGKNRLGQLLMKVRKEIKQEVVGKKRK